MEIILYKNLSDNVYVEKTLEEISTINGSFREDVNILNPVIVMESVGNVDLLNCNYVYIPELKRYYYVDSISIVRTNIYVFSCHVDVLMSYKDYLLALQGYVERNEKEYNPDLIDNELVFTQQCEITTTELPIFDGCLKFSGYTMTEDENIFVNAFTKTSRED